MSKTKKSTLSPFWKPVKIGEELSGKFIEFQSALFGPIMQLDSGLIPVNTVLKSRFRDVAEKMKPGDKVKIVFIGKGKGQRGKPSMLFEAYLNGKRLEGKFRAASKSEVREMFAEKEKKGK